MCYCSMKKTEVKDESRRVYSRIQQIFKSSRGASAVFSLLTSPLDSALPKCEMATAIFIGCSSQPCRLVDEKLCTLVDSRSG